MRSAAILALIAIGVLLLLAGVALTLAAPALGADAGAASPTPTPESGDARSGGLSVGPGGLLGLVAAFLVPLALAALAIFVTRLATRHRR